MYDLIKLINPIKLNVIKRYNKEHDIPVISKTGAIGDIIEIQNLKIALPPAPKKISNTNNRWEAHVYPKELDQIKTRFQWDTYPAVFKNKWYDYIDEEFNKRENGFWFINNNVPTYITGTHYMYLQWTKIDVGKPDFREANRIFYIFWEACKADKRCYGLCYLKNRRSGFSFMAKCLQIRLFQLVPIILSSSDPFKMVWTDLRQSLLTEFQRQSLQRITSKLPLGLTMTFRRDWIPLSTGKTQVTTLMMVKSFVF